MTRPELVALGALKMEGQFLTSGPMSYFNTNFLKIKYDFFNEPNHLDYVKI
jgi:hypothetical protein